MRIWITFMNITVRALVTTPTLTVQHMKNTDSALREQDIKRDSYMKEMKNCYEKQFKCSTSEGISDKETRVITTVQCKVKNPNKTTHSKNVKLHFQN